LTNTENRAGRLIVISAPSGAGKGTVIAELMKLDPSLKYSVSATTRPPRESETHGIHYYFVSNERFQEMINNGEFLEYAEYVGRRYGTPRFAVDENKNNGMDTILEIDVIGARQVRHSAPDAMFIFLAPPDIEELERRLRKRGGISEEEISKRLGIAKKEMEAQPEYDYTVINDTPERAAAEILGIIRGG